MQKEIRIQFNEDTLSVLETAAKKYELSLSAFLQLTALLFLTKNEAISPEDSIKMLAQTACIPNGLAKRNGWSARSAQTKFTEKQSDEIFDDFIRFLNQSLMKFQQPYVWKYEIAEKSRVPWLDKHLYSSEEWEDTCALLEACGAKMHQALKNKDEQLCYEAIRLCMDWGGVFYDYNRGVQRGNEATVDSLYENGELLKMIEENYCRIREDDIENLDYYTSGWGIVWYVLDMDKMFIMSSREIYALNKIILEYKKARNTEKLPPSVDIGQLVYQGNRRFIPEVRYIYTKKGKLLMYRRLLKMISALKKLGDFETNASIEKRLFMLGE